MMANYYMPVTTIGTPPDVDRYNVTNLQPDTRYLVQVAAVTSKGDGKRSDKVRVETPGGVPSMPKIDVKLVDKDPTITIDIEWTKPDRIYGELKGYRVRYGHLQQRLTDILITDPNVQHQKIPNLEKGIKYEFRVAGMNEQGPGQEAIKIFETPEGVPTDSPKNITTRFQVKKNHRKTMIFE